MPTYTAAETKIINGAWNALENLLDTRMDHTMRITRLVKEEIKNSKSPSFGQFTKAEARLYVMRAWLEGYSKPDMLASEVATYRQTLALAVIMGADFGSRSHEIHPERRNLATGKICNAVKAHDVALTRFLERNRNG